MSQLTRIPLDEVSQAFEDLKRSYDFGNNDLRSVGSISEMALRLLSDPMVEIVHQGEATLDGKKKMYELRRLGKNLSRPIRRDLFISSVEGFASVWRAFVQSFDRKTVTVKYPLIDSALYTAVISFAAAYDLYKPSSRKTPGTFFEVVAGAVLGSLSGVPRGKQIPLPGSNYRVTTDIILQKGRGNPVLVIPTKITSRERIVQPWAHQRILDDVFGKGKFKSIFLLVSELQRNKDVGVNEICVPGQVGLFQRYLGQIYGMYYLDPPAAYTTPEFMAILPVKYWSTLLGGDLKSLLEA